MKQSIPVRGRTRYRNNANERSASLHEDKFVSIDSERLIRMYPLQNGHTHNEASAALVTRLLCLSRAGVSLTEDSC
jgi:hypothetical protein